MAFNAFQLSGVSTLLYFENLTRRIEEITWSVEEQKTFPPKVIVKELLAAAEKLARNARRRGQEDDAEHWDRLIAGYETAAALLRSEGGGIQTGENL